MNSMVACTGDLPHDRNYGWPNFCYHGQASSDSALYLYFIDPLTSWWSIEEVLVKAGPLVLIGVGLAVCFKANVWNIGAEGQLTVGALMGAMVPVLWGEWQSPLALLAMLCLGAFGGSTVWLDSCLVKDSFWG